MGGICSGRYGGRPVVDRRHSLDINRLHREGCLRAGWWGGWHWTRNDERVSSVALVTDADNLHLIYRIRTRNEGEEDVEQTVRIVRVPCRFGGSRPYFICSGISCGRRVAQLHGPGRYFLCRHCYGLAYQSQREQRHDRALRRANAVRMRLGGKPGMARPFPEKPKGMHWRTYERLRAQVRQIEMVAAEHFAAQLSRLISKGGERAQERLWDE
jgi:hypothetical protein